MDRDNIKPRQYNGNFECCTEWDHGPFLPPKTIRLPACFPQLDGAVFAASGVELAVRREADGPDGAVVAFLHFYNRTLASVHPGQGN